MSGTDERLDKIEELGKQLVAAQTENDKLRGIIAWSALPCIYCGLSFGDQGQCASGFPGCARADDQMIYDPKEAGNDQFNRG